MMKRVLTLLLALAMALAVCACGEKKPDSPGNGFLSDKLGINDIFGEAETTPEPEDTHEKPSAAPRETDAPTAPAPAPAVESQSFSSDAGVSIDVIREEIGRSTALFGVAYIGYYEYIDATGIDFQQWLEGAASPTAAYYPFVTEIDQQHTVGEKGHVYCIIARDYGASIEVSDLDGEMLYRAENGDPILLLCSSNGDAYTPDVVVTITTEDGAVCRWKPALNEMDFPQFLVGDERELLSWDFTVVPDEGFDAEEWLSMGWSGVLDISIAGDDGLDWWISSADGSVSYCLSFYPNGGDSNDGEVVLECFYADDFSAQANWQGWWRIETELDRPTRLYMDMMLMFGDDMSSVDGASVVSEAYLAMMHPSGERLLLVADNGTILPVFQDGAQTAELTLGVG